MEGGQTVEEPIKTFSGSNNQYLVFAKRGHEELAISVQYEIAKPHPIGALLIRFVALSPKLDPQHTNGGFQPFIHLNPREFAAFKDQQGKEFVGVRLTRCAIPVFLPGPPALQFLQMADKFLVWNVVSDWITARANEDGFTVQDGLDLPTLLPKLIGGTLGDYNDELYQFVLEFPDLNPAPKTKEGE